MSDTTMNKPKITKRERRIRRTTILLGLAALAAYFGFIIATGLKG